MADGYRYTQASAGNFFYQQPHPQNQHARHILRNSTPPNNIRSNFATDTPSPTRSPDPHSPAPSLYGMFTQSHQQGQHSRINGGVGRGINGPVMYNYQHQSTHQPSQHAQHQASIQQQDQSLHTTNGSILGHHTSYTSTAVLTNALTNATANFTPSSLQNGHSATTRGGQAQQITEHWAEQLKLHKEAENANAQMIEHNAPNFYARQQAGENRKLNTSSSADAAAPDDGNEERGRPYRQAETLKRQDWYNMDLSGNGLKILANPIFKYSFLVELYVSSNKIAHLPSSIGELRMLRHLDASFNQLTELPGELGMCVDLRNLLLFNNRIESLPHELGYLHKLEVLGIEGNSGLPPQFKEEIMQRGTKSLIEQLRENQPVPMPPPQRKWISLQDGLPPNQETCKVASYNILCDNACTTKLYGYNPSSALAWESRSEQILQELRQQNADIICLQEVDTDTHQEFLSPKLAYNDYKGVYWVRSKAKTMTEKDAKRVDGLSIFYKGSKYILLDKQLIDFAQIAINRPDMKQQADIFNRVMPRDNIASILLLENRATGARLIIVNTHLFWDPKFPDVKLIQMAVLMETVNTISERYVKKLPSTEREKRAGLVDENGSPESKVADFAPSMQYSSNTQIPFILCGDLNSTTDSTVFDLLQKGVINSSHRELSEYAYGNFTRDGIQHPFNLRSAYTALEKTPDKLAFTNYTPIFADVIDHVWYATNTLELTGLLGGVDPEYMKTVPGFPNHHFPSDHILIAAEFVIKGKKEKKTHAEPDFGSSSRRRD